MTMCANRTNSERPGARAQRIEDLLGPGQGRAGGSVVVVATVGSAVVLMVVIAM
jgi:hypothetical protein